MRRERTQAEVLASIGARIDQSPEKAIAAAATLLRVRDRTGRIRPLVANPAQRRLEERRGRQNIVLKARQMGVTTWVAGQFFLRTITRPGTTTLLVAHTREASESIFANVRRMWEYLPDALREDALRLRRSNSGAMVFEETGSEFRVASASDENAGRGLSVQNLHCSEVGRWPGDAKATLAGLRAALAPDGELVLESTPNGAYGAFYAEWCTGVEAALCGEAAMHGRAGVGIAGTEAGIFPLRPAVSGRQDGHGLVRHFMPWWMEPAYAGPAVARAEMRAEERALVERHGLSEAQIGFRRGLERSYGVLREQEFAEDAEACFRATGACCFELEAIERRLGEVGEPVERRRNGALWVWLPPVPGRRYVMAVDTAGGGSEGDFAAVQVVDVATGMQCAELQERLRPAELSRVCASVAKQYGDVLIAVERNNHGSAVLALLDTWENLQLYRQGGEVGWLTSAGSKPEVVARLGALLQQRPERFLSRRLLGECRTFVRDERGHARAANGAHDDLVMSMAIAQAVRAEVVGRG